MDLVQIGNKLKTFWNSKIKAKEVLTADKPGAAATFHPTCFFGSLSKTMEPVVYLQPSRRYDDHTKGESLVRFAKHLQLQLLCPYYENVIEDFIDSLRILGYEEKSHCLQFVENNWKHDSLGARGVGWEVLIDGLEVAQFTFFEYMGKQKLSIDGKSGPTEIAYGIERLNVAFFKDQLKPLNDLELMEEKEISHLINSGIFTIDDLEITRAKIEKLIIIELPFQAYSILLEYNNILNILGNSLEYTQKKIFLDQSSEFAEKIAILYINIVNS